MNLFENHKGCVNITHTHRACGFEAKFSFEKRIKMIYLWYVVGVTFLNPKENYWLLEQYLSMHEVKFYHYF